MYVELIWSLAGSCTALSYYYPKETVPILWGRCGALNNDTTTEPRFPLWNFKDFPKCTGPIQHLHVPMSVKA